MISVMQNIVKVKSASYQRYEELLLKKEALRKEAENYKILYNEIFNTLNNDTHEAKMECIKKRKTISYCQNLKELDSPIYRNDLDSYIDEAMKNYSNTIDYILNNDYRDRLNKNIREHTKRIKGVYRQLAKLIHPDMNSDLQNDKTIQDLWNRTCIAYNCSNLEELEELEVLVNRYLESINHNYINIEIPDIHEKIFNLNREIDNIIHTDPYQYKYVIVNKKLITKKKKELLKELNDYKKYSSELDNQISEFNIIDK